MSDIIIYALVAFFVAGVVKGVVGIGMPMTAIGILSQITEPRLAIALAVIPIFVANSWQSYRSGNVVPTLVQYRFFAISLGIAIFLSTLLVAYVKTDILIATLGAVIALFAVTNFAYTPAYLPEKYDRAAQITSGAISGLFGGLTAIWGPPMVIYLLSRRVEKDEFMRVSGVLLFVGSIPLIAGYLVSGMLDGRTAVLSALMVVPTLSGFAIGERLRGSLNPSLFRKVLLAVFLLIGLNLLRRGLF